MTSESAINIRATVERLDIPISPNGDVLESEGVVNPAAAFDRNGNLLLYPRVVAPGNESRIAIMKAEERDGEMQVDRLGYILEPEEDYELGGAIGQGCEDPRVTFIESIDRYVMSYIAYGEPGPRVALAISADGYEWERLGLVTFPEKLGDNKDAAFFPEPVLSPNGVVSLAMLHRPMTLTPQQEKSNPRDQLKYAEEERPGIHLAYVPVEAVKKELKSITCFSESLRIMSPGGTWGLLKIGGGTPPIQIEEGWLSLFHGVDPATSDNELEPPRYSAGLMICDLKQPHRVRYRSPEPLFWPETKEELEGIVSNVVFPTALIPRNGRTFDVYYGMADYCIGRLRLSL